ncbi:23S rRNA pseudouridine(1911/1915/1917) synthase RluD [Legionella pneumophila]|uniref:23S rRNA pseudouridine(1911/1915/1917) synthase RluD n=1 Tax=Legionella pneumophila TaxID=446 RepID=UPI001A35F954|nr:23S rRNA pseudouridine(1911/1915/1917) synthase RluD [Legionella pneumophila]HAT9398819.1 23S rRNA pseudouridine(1911/1915/1917) synthase RluD [Legionella pneumophila subsp. pneumophila]MCW8402213.1 23S rRNA pseudouridine(1911/1915/1917) synthase RluD [Legionella pneumophila]MCZ4711930.1 23S rRNA pseudouridine(1911/1915/1917) synthase RluD [Legionella pneumophila]MDC7846608.1 ribosomal large subunit pseudouridine synthase D, RluD [Legionella pneumophila]HAT2068458.1 23S rRNA pseudouridine(1
MIEHIQQQLSVPRELHNQRVDSVLARLLPEYSRSLICNWIKTGAVTLNNLPCKPKDKALGGDLITINVDHTIVNTDFNLCKPENIPIQIIYEDSEVIVVNKPAGLVVHPGAGNKEHTLVNALLHHCPELQLLPRAGIIHRLDKDTTGLLIVAKNLISHTSLIRQMQNREIKRHYLTLVHGYVISGGTIDTGFGRHPKNRLKMAVTDFGRQAVTHYNINKHYKDFTLLNVSLMTGRTHQIRVHMNYINHPVVGDQLYGGRMKFPPNADEAILSVLKQFKRQALHACSISFCHPVKNMEITLNALLPDDFELLLNTLDQHDEK